MGVVLQLIYEMPKSRKITLIYRQNPKTRQGNKLALWGSPELIICRRKRCGTYGKSSGPCASTSALCLRTFF